MSSRRYLPLRAYGLVGDGRRTAALAGRDGSVDWWCLPRLEDASVFARLLDDRTGGFCSAAPAGAVHASPLWESSQRYRPGTNVLITEFRGADASLRVDDVMPPAPAPGTGRGEGPAGEGGEAAAAEGGAGPVLLRRLTARGGPVEAEVRFAPRFDYARRRPDFEERGGGWLATGGRDAGSGGPGEGPRLALAAGPEVSLELDGRRREVSGRFRVEPGEPRWLALRWAGAGDVRPVRPDRCEERLGRAVASWRRRAAPEGEDPLERAAARSALLLELLAVGPEGAVAAAPTTSLPGAGAPRDARRLHLPRVAGGAVAGGAGAARAAGRTAPAAEPDGAGGRARGVETLDHLHGHRGARPVVVGSGGDGGGGAATGTRPGRTAAGSAGDPDAGVARGDAPVRLAGALRRAGEAAREGRAGEARERVERVASLAGPTGLLAEAADPGSGRLLGDYPWAPAHAALIRAARAVAEAEGA